MFFRAIRETDSILEKAGLSGHTWTLSLLVVVCALLGGCRSSGANVGPSIEFTRIPQAVEDGRDKHDIIEGRVTGSRPGQQIVLYARSGKWWVQPLMNQPFTKIQPSTKWTNATHLGTEYAALLVEPSYRPPEATDDLPVRGGDVVAVAVVKGQSSPPSKMLQFSGYEWRVRNAPSNRGGSNLYDQGNAWTDASGALHLRIAKVGDKWTCAEVSLNRSLGYGTYSFTVRDISRLEPAAAFVMFTFDYSGADQNYREVAIEISRRGNPTSNNAQFIIHPFNIPTNVSGFTAPAGALTHSFRWEPGRVSFRTMRGAGADVGGRAVAEHVFTSGIPSPGIEAVRMALYVFGNAKLSLQNGTEVVIDKFEYLP
jgi:hypothetical protein